MDLVGINYTYWVCGELDVYQFILKVVYWFDVLEPFISQLFMPSAGGKNNCK